jgi:hypothetical protein
MFGDPISLNVRRELASTVILKLERIPPGSDHRYTMAIQKIGAISDMERKLGQIDKDKFWDFIGQLGAMGMQSNLDASTSFSYRGLQAADFFSNELVSPDTGKEFSYLYAQRSILKGDSIVLLSGMFLYPLDEATYSDYTSRINPAFITFFKPFSIPSYSDDDLHDPATVPIRSPATTGREEPVSVPRFCRQILLKIRKRHFKYLVLPGKSGMIVRDPDDLLLTCLSHERSVLSPLIPFPFFHLFRLFLLFPLFIILPRSEQSHTPSTAMALVNQRGRRLAIHTII